MKRKPAVRKEIDYRTPSGKQRYLGISISLLRSRDASRSGYVFNFQDLTDLRRLEQEVATKERMAALGRLSAAIAHEIRQPLTAMAGAVKELARLVPLEEDEKHLVEYRQPRIGAPEPNHHGFSQLLARKDLRISAKRCSLAAGRNADLAGEEAR